MGCKYIEVGVGLYCTSFLFHSRFEYSISGQRSRLFHCLFVARSFSCTNSEQACINAFDSVLAWLLRRESCNFEVNLRFLICYLPTKRRLSLKIANNYDSFSFYLCHAMIKAAGWKTRNKRARRENRNENPRIRASGTEASPSIADPRTAVHLW
jgi:hypothetical protein